MSKAQDAIVDHIVQALDGMPKADRRQALIQLLGDQEESILHLRRALAIMGVLWLLSLAAAVGWGLL